MPRNVLRPPKCSKNKTMFLELEPDVSKQDRLRQACSTNISWEPQKVLRTLLGGAVGEPGRFATA
eukprot:3048554-Pyramimonas_sp.AAC.1